MYLVLFRWDFMVIGSIMMDWHGLQVPSLAYFSFITAIQELWNHGLAVILLSFLIPIDDLMRFAALAL